MIINTQTYRLAANTVQCYTYVQVCFDMKTWKSTLMEMDENGLGYENGLHENGCLKMSQVDLWPLMITKEFLLGYIDWADNSQII